VLEFFLILLRALSFIPYVDYFRTILWANLGYMVILIPVIVLAIYQEVMIIRNNFEFYTAVKNNQTVKILLICFLVSYFFTEAIFFLVGIVEIIGDQFPKAINNPATYEKWTVIGYIGAYMMAPVIGYCLLKWFKSSLKVKSELNHNRFKIDILPAIPYMSIGFMITLIGVTIYNYELGFLRLK
jgi:hypothetical protein